MNWILGRLNRRKFLRYLSAFAGGLFLPGTFSKRDALAGVLGEFRKVKKGKNLSLMEKEHQVNIRVPLVAEDGANVPIHVKMTHPMEPDHYIKNIEIWNFNDPLINKGVYHFTPTNGRVLLMVQLRMNAGDANVFVAAECNKHGKWVASKKLKVAVGGC